MNIQQIRGKNIAGSIFATLNLVAPTILRPIARISAEPQPFIKAITAEGRKMWCDRIIYDLDDERIYAEGRTYTEPYRGN